MLGVLVPPRRGLASRPRVRANAIEPSPILPRGPISANIAGDDFPFFRLMTTARSPKATPNCSMNSGGRTIYGILVASTYVPAADTLPAALRSAVVELSLI